MPCALIATDVDGCLSPEDSSVWELSRFWPLVERIRQANGGEADLPPMTLCTGRPQPYVEALAKLLNIHLPAVCENGAVIYTLHDNHARLGPGVDAAGIGLLRAVRQYIDGQLLAEHPGTVVQYGKEAQLSVFSADPRVLPEMGKKVRAFAESQGAYCIGAGPDPQPKPDARATPGSAPGLDIGLSHFYLNISLAGVDKGRALRAVMAELGLTADRVAAVGDTDGDLPLRRAVGWFACPANATPAVKAAADYVSPYADMDGMIDILSRPEVKRG